MPSQTKENYLKAMYFLDQEGEKIALSELSKRMEVSAPTANSMVKKLQDKGWVVYEKYKPLQLTDLGKKTAALIIRKHRLTEMFLVENMGFGWEEVHDIAEEMEHIDSEILFDRMDELLGFPTTDPHGSPIPNKEGEILVKKNYLKLLNAEVGAKVRLKALARSETEFLVYLNSKNLELETEIEVLSKESFDESMMIRYDRGQQIMLSKVASEQLLVEVI